MTVTKWRLIYDNKAYVFDEYPLEGVDVERTQMLELTTSKGRDVRFLISSEIPLRVEAFTPGSGTATIW